MSKKVIYLEDAITAVEIGAFSAATIYGRTDEGSTALHETVRAIKALPPAEPEQRYTEEELRVFAHGISLSLLSKRSAQHWQYDEDTATEIEFLERLYDKVVADMRGDTRHG